jgi:hypothetical protein
MEEFSIIIAQGIPIYELINNNPLDLEITTLIMARPKHDFSVSLKKRID